MPGSVRRPQQVPEASPHRLHQVRVVSVAGRREVQVSRVYNVNVNFNANFNVNVNVNVNVAGPTSWCVLQLCDLAET